MKQAESPLLTRAIFLAVFISLFVVLTGTGGFAQVNADKMEKEKRKYLGIYCSYQTMLEDHWMAELEERVSDAALDAIKEKAVRDKDYKTQSLSETLSALRRRGRAIYKKKRAKGYIELMEKFLFKESLKESYIGDSPSKADCEKFSVEETERQQEKAQEQAEWRQKAAQEEARQRQAKVEKILALSTMVMVDVPGGSFAMGCTPEQKNCEDDEKPTHQVQVKIFQIGKYELTQELWWVVMGRPPFSSGNCVQCPAEGVSWDAVQVFLKKLNDLTGERYRLPTEAEWEYAARGGQQSKGYQYAGADEPDSVAWYSKKSGNPRTYPVGQKQSNELGLYDMSGNVEEWVQDCWNRSYMGTPSDGTAWEQGNCRNRVLRGGSSKSYPRALRSAYRRGFDSAQKFHKTGFRLARTIP